MRSKTRLTILRSAVVLCVAAVVLCCAILAPNTKQSVYGASYIQKLDANSLKLNYEDFIDSNVMYKLPDSVGADEEISVIITVGTDSLMDVYEASDKTMSFSEFAATGDVAEKVAANVKAEKNKILKKLDEKKVSYETGEEYSAVLSGFEIIIKAGDFKTTCQSLGKGNNAIVGEVYNVAETKLVENNVNVLDTGIFDSSASGYDGSGMVVAVLDTGLDSAHSAFSVDNFTSDTLGLTYEDVAAVVDETTASKLANGNLGVDDVYINKKVPFGYDYADNDPDVYSTHNNHGTHVSGIIVGKDDTITGVAPNAQLVSMKIFSDVMDTARTAWILSALEDCVVLGVDVINMSLGTACGFSRESDEEVVNGVYDRIREAGISMIVAASNSYSSAYGSEANGNLGLTSNPDTGTVGSPSTYEGVMSVASIDGTETPYILYNDTIIYFDESTDGSSNENNFFETLLGEEKAKDYAFVVIPGVGRSADYTGLDVEGKIVLVRRGSNTFEEKALIAEAQGAAGIIIYNNVSGEIKMNVGEAKLAVCSISQDDGEMLAATGGGTLKISKEQSSGPFMTGFSSWGPSPTLGIKPEITAHGGNILSAITGGSYDRLSGTSMACPNLAGVVALLRQYVVENFPEIADDNAKVTSMVYCLMMSTADIVYNTNGLPYSVRKQGAGLASLMNSIKTPAYIITYDKDGNAMDKTKLELGDDAEKNGVYEMSFDVKNFGDKAVSYDIGYYVFTEGVSETKTNAGETTVTEEAYLLDGAKFEIVSAEGGALSGKNITVDAGKTAKVTVKITLGDADKKYLDESFENGMYVEGFITLEATAGTEIDMNVPYLAFYGDWLVAPLFDRDYYETNADELDNAIDPEDKTMADAYATRPVGGVSDDFVSYLGSYYFIQNPEDIVISASRDYIALSNQVGTVHSLRFVWAGLLRNAQKIVITITDDTTGEVVFECEDTDVRKSYGDGASIYPANVEIEFDTMDYNLANNTEYTVKLVGYLDYGNGGLEENEKNVFEFPLVADFEAPTVEDVEFYYEYDKTAEKNRLYAKIAVYDNHYAMCAQLGYIVNSTDENGNAAAELKSFEQFMTPIYSKKNATTYVTYELTDYVYDIKDDSLNKNSFVVTVYDYALNIATFEIGLPDDYVDFYFDSLAEGVTLSPNEVYKLEPLVYPDTEWAELLEFTSSKPSVVRVVNNKLVAVSSGTATIKAQDPETNKSVTFKVNVLKEGQEGYNGNISKPVADIFRLDGYKTMKAYYLVDNTERDIGETGNIRFFEGNYSLALFPSETVLLNYTLDAFFPNDTTVEFESSNENIVKIDDFGNVTGVAEGFASVSVKVLQDGKSTYYSETVSVEVKDPYIKTGASLTHYFGNGGVVNVPADLNLKEIGNFSFANFNYIMKTEEELEFDDASDSKQWYIGEGTITKVILPEGIEKIGCYAFANLTALEEIVLPSTLEAIEYGAFYGCTSLKKITFSGDNNLKIVNQNAFENCDVSGTLDLSAACVISDYAFAGNQNLKEVKFSDTLLSIGEYAFAGCKKLESVTVEADKVKYGQYAFTDCEKLTSFRVNASVIPAGMFYQCEALKEVTIGKDVNDIGEFAFRETAIDKFVVEEGNPAFSTKNGSVILSADGKKLMAVAPTFKGEFTEKELGAEGITVIGKAAFSHATKITSVVLDDVTVIEAYGLASSTAVEKVKFGTLTEIGEYAFFETAVTELPAFTNDAKIGKYAFSFTDLKSVKIPDNMVIAEGVFSECLSLEAIVIGNNVTIGEHAFEVNKDYIFKISSYNEGDEKYFYYTFSSPIKNITIGDNAIILENAFVNAASVEKITLGAGAKIGKMAFYNCCALKSIDLSKAVEIGEYAFSGDVYYICQDDSMQVGAVSKDGKYMYTYHAPALEKVDVSSSATIGKYAFAYCRSLKDVELGELITEIPEYAFAGCTVIENIDLSKITKIGDYAFIESGIKKIDLSSCESVGEYAFVYCKELSDVTLSPAGTDIGEGTFSYCESLAKVKNIEFAENLDAYSFAYTAIVDVDLSGAVSLGDRVFLKEELTPFKVTLGEKLTALGDNPFSMCIVEPFAKTEVKNFNGVDYETKKYTYDISDSVFVIDGSLYCKIDTGLELITFAGNETENVKVADNTVRITSMAFAGSDVNMVTIPYTVKAIGHKAFYMCDKLTAITFTSYDAPILEEEFDPAYYESFEHVPGTGSFGEYVDYEGNSVIIEGVGIIPYYMWNATDGMYSNVFYGANFVDYVGYVEDKLVLVHPVNGQHYDTYIMNQYFRTAIEGAAAADDTTLAAIAAINAIPERVEYSDKAMVEAARQAYSKIATTEQQALVAKCGAYEKLVSAEARITQLAPEAAPETEAPADKKSKGMSTGMIVLITVGGSFLVIFTVIIVYVVAGNEKKRKAEEAAKAAEKAEEAAEEISEEITEEISAESCEEVPEEASEEACEEASEETQEDSSESEE
ncbi:MAG: leucine-rich repeat protein [Clostridia bacterium]|nr:leucine-rich repeat protein [Clostridia bacterium]